MSTWHQWNKPLNALELVSFKHLIDPAGRGRSWKSTIEGVQGGFAERDGFSLNPKGPMKADDCGVYWIHIDGPRSKNFDYIGRSANYTAAPYQRGISGRVFDHLRKILALPKREQFGSAIMKSQNVTTQVGAQKLLSKQQFENYADFRRFLTVADTGEFAYHIEEKFLKAFQSFSHEMATYESIKKFLSKRVSISFNCFYPSPDSERASKRAKDHFREEIAKAEGLAIHEFLKIKGELPNLNSRDEIASLGGFGS